MPSPVKHKQASERSSGEEQRDWRNLLGYNETLARLQETIKAGRLPPVILFAGREGTGKRTFLQAVAALFFCVSQSACGSCPPCRRLIAGENPDILTLGPEDGRIRLEQAEQLLAHLAHIPRRDSQQPFARRIVCVNDCDVLTPQAANLLLKTLEEPPPRAAVLMSSARRKAIMPTLLSRAMVWPLTPPSVAMSLQLIKSKLSSKHQPPLLSDEGIKKMIERHGMSPGKVLASLGADMLPSEAFPEMNLLLAARSLGEVLEVAETLGKKSKLTFAALLFEWEYKLNQHYRQQLGQDHKNISAAMIQKRRELLSHLHQLALKQKINLNGQLALEALALTARAKFT